MQASVEAGAGGAPDARVEIPLQPLEGCRDSPAACGGLHVRAGEEHEEFSSCKWRCGRDNVWTDQNSHSLSPCASGGEEVEKTAVKLSLEQREGWVGYVSKIWLYFLLPFSDLIGNKWTSFPKLSLFPLWHQLMSEFSLSLFWPTSLFLYFLWLIHLRKKVVEWL